MFCNWSTMGAGGWLMMSGLWLAVIVLVLWAAMVAVRAAGPHPRRCIDAVTVLDDRLARGDIEPEEYRLLRSTLEDAR
jgi:uncharacterized membrane protein